MAISATVPAVPAETTEAEITMLEVHFRRRPAGTEEWASECIRVPADKIPATWLAGLETKIKARIEKTEAG